jgi:hypothetical protein
MRAGLLRVSYFAVDERGQRAEALARVEQGSDGRFAEVFTSDPRAVDVVLELRDGDAWREVRAQRTAGGAPRVLPGPYARATPGGG